MNLDIPAWAAYAVAFLLLLGSGLTLIGSLGLLRLDSFYKRAHAPTLATTLGTAFVSLASALYFSSTEMRLLAPEILILVFVTLTTPVTLMLLIRAALFRDRAARDTEATSPSAHDAIEK